MSHSLTCTFCRKTEHHVRKLVAGPGVYICDECIEIAHQIITDTPQAPRASRWRSLRTSLGRVLRIGSNERGVRLSDQATGVSGA